MTPDQPLDREDPIRIVVLGPGITLFVSADQNDCWPGWGRSGGRPGWAAAAVKKATAAKMQIAGIAVGNCAKTARETANLSITLITIPLSFCLCRVSFEKSRT